MRSLFERQERGEHEMIFYVTYRITHPEHSPTSATGTVEAPTRQDLEVRLARRVGKSKTPCYTIEILKVTCLEALLPSECDEIEPAAGPPFTALKPPYR